VKETFYKRQRRGTFGYRLLLVSFVIFMFLPIAVIALMCYETFVTMQDFVSFIQSGSRLSDVFSYEQLSHFEKQEINNEITHRFKTIHLGENYLYHYQNGFLHFTRYGDIVWAFQQNFLMPIMMADLGNSVILESSFNQSSLIFYTADGNQPFTTYNKPHNKIFLQSVQIFHSIWTFSLVARTCDISPSATSRLSSKPIQSQLSR